MSCHAATGMARHSRHREVERLLRTAESACRSAVALLMAAKATALSTGDAQPPPGKAARRRHKKKATNTKAMDVESDEGGGKQGTAPGATAVPGSQAKSADDTAKHEEVTRGGSSAQPRTLQARVSRERSPHRLPGASGWQVNIGGEAVVKGLAARPELNNEKVTVLQWIGPEERFVFRFSNGSTGKLRPDVLTCPWTT